MAEPTTATIASSPTTRCARPDCISLREELELLRGDLQEIESENEQLHDKITQLDGEKQTRSQELMREQTVFNDKIAEKDAEIAQLNQVARDLDAELKEERTRASSTSKEAVAARPSTSIGGEDARISRLEQECIELRGKNEALEKKLEELRAASARELAASVNAKHAVEQMAQESKDKRSELYKVLKENEMLRGEKTELEDALRATAEAALENESLVKVMYEHQNVYKDATDEQTVEITQLHTKLEQLECEKQHLEAKLIEMDERESDVEALLNDAKRKHDMEKAVLRNELDEMRKQVQELEKQQKQKQKQQASGSEGTAKSSPGQVTQAALLAADTDEMEKQLEVLQELRIRDKSTIAELNQRVLQQQSDLESLMEHLDVDAAIENAVQGAVEKEQSKNATMRQENVNIERRLKEQSEVLHEMEFRQSQLEKELVEAQQWNAKYEQNAGLEDVMKLQKQLRKQLEKQQQANVKLRHDLNEQIEATGKIHIAFERLKVKTGKPSEFAYDDIAVENHLKGELAVNQAVMAQMEHQIQELEADRVCLLQELREQARMTGHKLYEAHGVPTEQWQLVEEFIDRVKRTPEVAKRLLFSSNETTGTLKSGEGSNSPAQVDQDVVVKYETEIANSHAENMKLVKEIARLRSELEQTQTQVALASNRAHHGDTPRADKEATEDIREIREQIQLIMKEQEMQRSQRDLLASNTAKTSSREDAKPSKVLEDDVESLSSSDDEEFVEPKETKKANVKVKQNISPDERGQNAQDSHSSLPESSAAITTTPRPKSTPSPKRNEWVSAESIAMAVAKALESRLSQLQTQQQQQLRSGSSTESGKDDTTIQQTSKGVPRGSKTPPTTNVVDTLAFESEEEMILQLDVLKELNVCLDELVRSEAQNEDLQQQLAQHEHAFKSLVDQHTVLYHHFFHMHSEYQAELQQAAQATIASLKLLVEEKNGLIQEYQKKMASVRHDAAQVKAQDRLETTQLNKKLYEENQRMISQLKEAMDTIKHLERTGKDKKAVQAAQERHKHVLKEWKQVEIALEKAKQTIKELQMEIEVLKNERDIAEARAGEALEEIVLTKDIVAEQEMIGEQLENQLVFVKRDLVKKEDKMKLLRGAIIKLKEEFLKAEDRHAVEIAKAQQAAGVNSSKKKKDHKEEEEQWKEDKERLESQVQILQKKLELQKKQEAKLKRERAAAARTDKPKKALSGSKRDDDAVAQDAVKAKVLEDEIERLRRVVKERVVSEARVVEDLEKKLRVLEAQNLALREASASTSSPDATERSDAEKRATADLTSKTREQWEVEKKLQRRNEILMLRLKEKHAELDEKEKELEQTKERLLVAQQEQAQLKKAEQKRAVVSSSTGAAAGDAASLSTSVKEQIDELERQNNYLQETLVLKRREWEEAFVEQMTKYETELKRLRRRLTQHGVPVDEGRSRRDERQQSERLHLEEQQFLISEEVNDELVLLGDELRSKEQEIIQKDTRIMEMELELESVRMEYKRMQRRSLLQNSQQQQNQPQQQQGIRRAQSRLKGGKPASSIRSPAQERLELEEVIENMKKVIEKLRSENEKLKKHSVSPGKMDILRRKLKEHKDAREQLESEVENLRVENAELKKEKLRLQQKLRVASSTLTTAGTSGSSARQEQELRDLQPQVKEKDELLAQFESEAREHKHTISRKGMQIQELQFQLENVQPSQQNSTEDAALNDEIIKELEDHVLELEEENAKLQNELAAFDEDFFEEIEDLKYKYAQAVREKQQLEKRLRSKG